MTMVDPAQTPSAPPSPISQSSAVIDSSGLWLTPPLQRRNSMPAGHSAPMIIVSWPAPDGSRRAGWPMRSTAALSPATMLRDRRHRRPPHASAPDVSATLRALAIAVERAWRCRRRRAGAARRAARACRCVNRASPGMTFTAPGSTSSRPTVATRSSSMRARAPRSSGSFRRRRRARRWRRFIGTAPAWPASAAHGRVKAASRR